MWSTIFCRPSVAFKTGVTETLEAQSAPKNKEDEIEAKKAWTINQKTFGTGSEGGTSGEWQLSHIRHFRCVFAGLRGFLYPGDGSGQSNVVALGVVYTIFLQKQ